MPDDDDPGMRRRTHNVTGDSSWRSRLSSGNWNDRLRYAITRGTSANLEAGRKENRSSPRVSLLDARSLGLDDARTLAMRYGLVT